MFSDLSPLSLKDHYLGGTGYVASAGTGPDAHSRLNGLPVQGFVGLSEMQPRLAEKYF